MDVKVVNLRSSDFGSEFRTSLMETGFAVLNHHGVDHGLIKEAQMVWRLFFLSDEKYKEKFTNESDPNMGYSGFKSEKAVGAIKADLKSFFHWKPGKVIPHEVAAITMQLFYQLEDVSSQLLSALDINGTQYRKACESSDNTLLRTLYYPKLDFSQEPGAVRAAAHEDINFITLLVAASAPGLEVLDKRGDWHSVPHEDNTIVINAGDMLQLASKGLYKSTTHRVINPAGEVTDRLSMPLFVHPHGDTLLSEGFTAREFLKQRLDEIYQRVKT